MNNSKTKIAILGGGPAGLALAMKLLRRIDLDVEVVLIEQKPWLGGLTASFEHEGLYFDYGSHRLHPATDEEILKDVKALLGSDLLMRPRNGRIRLLGRFVKFPLNALDLVFKLPLSFILGIGWDIISKPLRHESNSLDSYADILLGGLGKTICESFYFPYAYKLWGLDPRYISAVQAKRRVSARNVSRIMRKVLSITPRFGSQLQGHFFYYPRKGYGQISQALGSQVESLGGKILLSTKVKEVRFNKSGTKSILVDPSRNKKAADDSEKTSSCKEILADLVFSTIPLTALVNCLQLDRNSDVKNSCKLLRYRGMVLFYIVLETNRFTPYDAHYFPDQEIIFSRISEPKNYSGSQEPKEITGLCVEIPCFVGDAKWKASEDEISKRVIHDLDNAGVPIRCPIKTTLVRRFPNVYPVYDLNFETIFQKLDNYLNQISGLITLGRQGLFAHDNTHHTIEMAYRASECLKPGPKWDLELWQSYREQFKNHLVED